MADENCKQELADAGKPLCWLVAKTAKYVAFDMGKDSSGDPKERDNTVLTNFAELKVAIDEVNPLDRIYPIPYLMVNADQPKADPVYFTSNGGAESFVRDNSKVMTAMILNAPRELADKLNANRGQDFGFYFWDAENQVSSGKGSTTDKVKPIGVNSGSFHATYVEWSEANSTPAHVLIRWQWAQTVKDSTIKTQAGLDYTGNDLYGLVDADATYSGISINGFTATIKTCYDDLVEGLVLGDFTLAEISPTPADVTGNIAGVAESAPVLSRLMTSAICLMGQTTL